LESFAWSRPLDGLESEKTPWATQHIPDPLYAAPSREAIIGLLIATAAKAIGRWEVLLSLVSSSMGFQLPSYEEPLPESEVPPPDPDTGKSVHATWLPADLETPHHWTPPTFTSR
jgi:hypothetical protein